MRDQATRAKLGVTVPLDHELASDSGPISPEMRAFLSNDSDVHLTTLKQLNQNGDLEAAQSVARELLQRLDIHPNVLFEALNTLPPDEVSFAVKYLWSAAEHLRIPLLLSLHHNYSGDSKKIAGSIDRTMADEIKADPALFHLAARLGQA